MKKSLKDKKLSGMEVPQESVQKLEREKNHHRKHTKVDKDKEKGKNKIILRSKRSKY